VCKRGQVQDGMNVCEKRCVCVYVSEQKRECMCVCEEKKREKDTGRDMISM